MAHFNCDKAAAIVFAACSMRGIRSSHGALASREETDFRETRNGRDNYVWKVLGAR